MTAATVNFYLARDDFYDLNNAIYGDFQEPKLRSPDWHQTQSLLIIALNMSWISIMGVKLAFLMFFRRLLAGLTALRTYWWTVLVLNLAVLGYGIAVNVIEHLSLGESKKRHHHNFVQC